MKFRYRHILLLGVVSIAAILFGSAAVQAQVANPNAFATPRLACNAARAAGGSTIVRDLEHDCLIKIIINGQFVSYVHYYDSGDNFCVQFTNPNINIGPNCVAIALTGRAPTPNVINEQPRFKVRELQFDTLPTGNSITAGADERFDIRMPDGSLIQMDEDATFTPISAQEVHSVFGRFRYVWKPFKNGRCIEGQKLDRAQCRIVAGPDVFIVNRATEYLVTVGQTGTLVQVIEGQVAVMDQAEKKPVELVAGMQTFIKPGEFPADPSAFDASKLDKWWTKKDPRQVIEALVAPLILGLVGVALLLTSIRSHIRKSRRPSGKDAAAGKPATITEKPEKGPKFCPHCGGKLAHPVAHCPACGKPITASETEGTKRSKSFWLPLAVAIGSFVWLGFVAETPEKAAKNNVLILLLMTVFAVFATVFVIRVFKLWRSKKNNVQAKKDS